MKYLNNITAEYLRSVLEYNSETGIFTWKERPLNHFCDKRTMKYWNAMYSNKETSPNHGNGYSRICINHKKYYVHRLAWLWMTGEWPKEEIDHIDANGKNNKWNNLRKSTSSQNSINTSKRSDNTSGFRGVSFIKEKNLWSSRIHTGKERLWLGYFDSPEEASVSYNIAAEALHGEYRRIP